jgi:hypothetical protein
VKRNYTREELDKTIHGLEAEVDISEILSKEILWPQGGHQESFVATIRVAEDIGNEPEVPKINWNIE